MPEMGEGGHINIKHHLNAEAETWSSGVGTLEMNIGGVGG